MSDHTPNFDYSLKLPRYDDAAEEDPAYFLPAAATSSTPFAQIHPPAITGGWEHSTPVGQLCPPSIADDWMQHRPLEQAFPSTGTDGWALGAAPGYLAPPPQPHHSAQLVPFQSSPANDQQAGLGFDEAQIDGWPRMMNETGNIWPSLTPPALQERGGGVG
ncbi:hypothetical protein MMC10_007732 [Thelotrema lepadinum]|nr:hypothetical protein [Thelotrema lepadinum]